MSINREIVNSCNEIYYLFCNILSMSIDIIHFKGVAGFVGGGEEETWEHVVERCAREEGDERGIGEKIKEILDEGGKGEEWMKRLARKCEGGREEGKGEGVKEGME